MENKLYNNKINKSKKKIYRHIKDIFLFVKVFPHLQRCERNVIYPNLLDNPI